MTWSDQESAADRIAIAAGAGVIRGLMSASRDGVPVEDQVIDVVDAMLRILAGPTQSAWSPSDLEKKSTDAPDT